MTKTKLHLNDFKMGYIILFQSKGGWLSDQIVKEQRRRGFNAIDAQYTHVAISGGGPFIVDVFPPRSMVTDFTKRHKGRYIKLLRYRDYVDENEKKRYKVSFWAASLSNIRYDWLGVLKFRLSWLFHFRKRFFCSENCLWALQKEFHRAMCIEPHECMPAHFTNEDFFEIVWEGQVPDESRPS